MSAHKKCSEIYIYALWLSPENSILSYKMDASSPFQGVRFSLEGPLEMDVLPRCPLIWARGEQSCSAGISPEQTVPTSCRTPVSIVCILHFRFHTADPKASQAMDLS